MLWALAFLGVLPAALSLDVFEQNTDDDELEDAADLNATNDSDNGEGDLLDDAVSPAEPEDDLPEDNTAEDDQEVEDDVLVEDDAQDYDFVADGADVTISDFESGVDTVTLHLTDDGSGAFSVETMLDETGNEVGVSLVYFDGTLDTAVDFLGLSEVPIDDITIGFLSDGAVDEALLPLDTMDGFNVIAPSDPDAPEVPQGTGDEDSDGVATNDPDAPETPTDSDPSDDEAIAPNPADDAEVETDPAIISNFAVGTELLDITIASDAEPASVVVELTEDGASSQVLVNGEVAAVISGSTDATLADVRLVYQE